MTDLNLIAEQLSPGKPSDSRINVVIHGLGGIGKTQLAIEYARAHKHSYSSFFWLDGKTEESLIQSILRIPKRLPENHGMYTGLSESAHSKESKEHAQQILQWFAMEGNTRRQTITTHCTMNREYLRQQGREATQG